MLKRLKSEMEKLISQGITTFICGGGLGFDTIAASMVVSLKEMNPAANIKLIFALPCKKQTKYWKQKDIVFYKELLQEADDIIYTSDHYFSEAMHVRNRWMVDNSAYCICYLTQSLGGTVYTTSYAKEKELTIIKILRIIKS